MLTLIAGSISAVNQQQYYLYWPHDKPFHMMGLYKHIGLTKKITETVEDWQVLCRHNDNRQESAHGRPKEPRGQFSPEHPQHGMHVVQKCTVWVIPVILGDKIPCTNWGDKELKHWVCAIITLFVPWRHPWDLKEEGELWYTMYETCSEYLIWAYDNHLQLECTKKMQEYMWQSKLSSQRWMLTYGRIRWCTFDSRPLWCICG